MGEQSKYWGYLENSDEPIVFSLPFQPREGEFIKYSDEEVFKVIRVIHLNAEDIVELHIKRVDIK